MGQLQLCQQLCFGAVLVLQPPCAAAAPVPAVGKLHGQGVFAVLQQRGHIVCLVLQPLAVIRDAGSADKIAHTLPVESGFIQAAGGDIQPGFLYVRERKNLAEAVHGVALFFVDLVITGDPLGTPCTDAGLKGYFAPIACCVLFIPEPHLPKDLRFRRHGGTAPFYAHGSTFHPTAVPENAAAIIGCNDLIGSLLFAAITVPIKPGRSKIHTHGVKQMLRFQSNGLHTQSSFCTCVRSNSATSASIMGRM